MIVSEAVTEQARAVTDQAEPDRRYGANDPLRAVAQRVCDTDDSLEAASQRLCGADDPLEAVPQRLCGADHLLEAAPQRLCGADDPPPWTRRVFGRRFPAVLACDHASRAVPRALGTLGLTEAQLSRHIAWDIGAGALAEALAQRLGIAVVACGYSRLVIDCNRRLDDPTSIVETSDGERIPGNLGLTSAARALRAREIFAPYHAALAAELDAVATAAAASVPAPAPAQVQTQTQTPVPDLRPALIAIHSFTDVFGGCARPWHCGILWDRDPRLALPLLAALRAEPGLVVGDNEPYSGRHPADYTVDTHGERHGRPHVCIEVRQDLLVDAAGIAAWADRLASPLAALLADASLYRAAGIDGGGP